MRKPGKRIGNKIYVHKSAQAVLPQKELKQAQRRYSDVAYDVVAFNKKTGAFTFSQVPGWDNEEEPEIGIQVLVPADRMATEWLRVPEDPWIFHHKWQFVADDYQGFDVEASKRRSASWEWLPGVNRRHIGRKSYWEDLVVPRIALWDLSTLRQEFPSSKTSINSSKLPALFNELLVLHTFQTGQVIADIGGGKFDNAVEWAAEYGAKLWPIDPFNRSVEFNRRSIQATAGGQSDLVVCSNTLNVLKEPRDRLRVMRQALDCLRPGAQAYFSVYEGNRSGVGSSTQGGESWQNNFRRQVYVEELKAVFPKVTVERGLIVAQKE